MSGDNQKKNGHIINIFKGIKVDVTTIVTTFVVGVALLYFGYYWGPKSFDEKLKKQGIENSSEGYLRAIRKNNYDAIDIFIENQEKLNFSIGLSAKDADSLLREAGENSDLLKTLNKYKKDILVPEKMCIPDVKQPAKYQENNTIAMPEIRWILSAYAANDLKEDARNLFIDICYKYHEKNLNDLVEAIPGMAQQWNQQIEKKEKEMCESFDTCGISTLAGADKWGEETDGQNNEENLQKIKEGLDRVKNN